MPNLPSALSGAASPRSWPERSSGPIHNDRVRPRPIDGQTQQIPSLVEASERRSRLRERRSLSVVVAMMEQTLQTPNLRMAQGLNPACQDSLLQRLPALSQTQSAAARS